MGVSLLILGLAGCAALGGRLLSFRGWTDWETVQRSFRRVYIAYSILTCVLVINSTFTTMTQSSLITLIAFTIADCSRPRKDLRLDLTVPYVTRPFASTFPSLANSFPPPLSNLGHQQICPSNSGQPAGLYTVKPPIITPPLLLRQQQCLPSKPPPPRGTNVP